MKRIAAVLLGSLVVGVAGVEDTQAPVISLNLDGVTPLSQVQVPECAKVDDKGQQNDCKRQVCHTSEHWSVLKTQADCTIGSPSTPHKSTYARKCPVFSNRTTCPLPEASVFDMHDSDVAHRLETTYTLYLKSDKHKDPVLFKQEQTRINYDQRGEYIVSYDVDDAAGNSAETVHFVVVLQDHVKPSLKVDAIAPVESYGTGERQYVKNLWVGLEALDDYDGNVTDVIEATYTKNPSVGTQHVVGTKGLAAGITVDSSDIGVHHIDYKARDFANIFGLNNADNFVTGRYSFKVQDTLPPTLYCNPVDVVTTRGTFPANSAVIASQTVSTVAECAQLCYKYMWDRLQSSAPCAYFQISGTECSLYGASAKRYYGSGSTDNIQGEVPDCDTKTVVDCVIGSFADTGALCIDLRDSYASDGKYLEDAIIPKVSGDTVDIGVPSTYKIKYNCQDAHKNKADRAVRTVIVKDDTTPVLTLNGDFQLSYEMEYGSAANSLMMKKFTTAFDDNGFQCVDECTGHGSRHGISHDVKIQAYEGNCNGAFSCFDENGVEKSCDGGDDNFAVEIEDVLMPGVWGLKYTCSDGSGNTMARCRTVYNNVGEDDDAAFGDRVIHPVHDVDVQLVVDWSGCSIPEARTIEKYTDLTLRHQLGINGKQIKHVKAYADSSTMKIDLTLDGKCETCNAEILHMVREKFIHQLKTQYGPERSCAFTNATLDGDTIQLPVDCEVNQWTAWSTCSRECGPGVQQRMRSIRVPAAFNGKVCPETDQVQQCQLKACGHKCPGNWGDWTPCSKTCGTGVRMRELQEPEQDGCSSSEQQVCKTTPCPVECHVSSWSVWSPCNKACGAGSQYQYRRIVDQPKHSGPACDVQLENHRICNDMKCSPKDCKVGPWGVWSKCSQECGGGVQRRTRKQVSRAEPGGRDCPALETVRNCNIYKCPAFCGAVWNEWPPCPVTCGRGVKQRTQYRVNVTGTAEQLAHFTCPMIQESVCNYEPCKVDCTVSSWSDWGQCDATCGTGSKTRTRRIEHVAEHGGEPCEDLEETKWCNMKECPVDCVLSAWEEGSGCSTECGGGIRTRTRSVLLRPQHNGKKCDCLIEHVPCNARTCDSRCAATKWKGWSKCTEPCDDGCGGGIQTRQAKNLESLLDRDGRLSCPTFQTKVCEAPTKCSVDCMWGAWSDWDACTNTCGKGHSRRTRQPVRHALFGGAKCDGEDVQTSSTICDKPACARACKMHPWGAWGACDRQCGGGVQQRTREVVRGYPACPGTIEYHDCNTHPCVGCQYTMTEWSVCTNSRADNCGRGIQTRKMQQSARQKAECAVNPILCPANHGALKCPSDQERTCDMGECVLDCQVGAWTAWQGCTVTCAGGHRRRTRERTREASRNGAACPPLVEVEQCNTEHCPTDCVVSNWGSFDRCSNPCGGGFQTRRRNVLLDVSYAGMPCPAEEESRNCNTRPCPIDCEFTVASDWSECDRSCGANAVQRKRITIHKHAMFDGQPCPEEEERLCSVGKQVSPCPVDCELGTWTEWSECSVECGGGWMTRTRKVLRQDAHGGIQCQPMLDNTKACNTHGCPVDCVVSGFGPWSACSRPCGFGVQHQTRKVVTNQGHAGARCPPLTKTRDCPELKACNVGCAWKEWGACSVSCGLGVQTSRINPRVHADWECPLTAERVCGEYDSCPVSCEVGSWSKWSSCSKTCRGGFEKRTRAVTKRPELGGILCPELTQVKDCGGNAPCPVNCVMGDPTEWTTCTKSCGVGKMSRNRERRIPAANGGTACPTVVDCPHDGRKKCSTETRECAVHACPVNCEVEAWGAWGPCSSKCGTGVHVRNRYVKTHPSARGRPCPSLQDAAECTSEVECSPCNHPWEDWSECSASCGGGTRTRHVDRNILQHVANANTCTEEEIHHFPRFDVAGAINGKSYEVEVCNEAWGSRRGFHKSAGGCGNGWSVKEPVDWTFSGTKRRWRCVEDGSCRKEEAWKKKCGKRDNKLHQRDGECYWTSPAKAWNTPRTFDNLYTIQDLRSQGSLEPSDFVVVEIRTCTDSSCADASGWTQTIKRNDNFNRNSMAKGAVSEKVTSTVANPTLLAAGHGFVQARIHIKNDKSLEKHTVDNLKLMGGCTAPVGTFCALSEEQVCNSVRCPIDCVWADWTDWTTCSQTCGGGVQHRSRTVGVRPEANGRNCPGTDVDVQACNEQACPEDCVVSQWSSFSECSKPCGGGTQERYRTVLTEPSSGGAACPALAGSAQCNTHECPIDCKLSDTFREWSECDRTCGGGSQKTSRTIVTQPAFGGAECANPVHTQGCNEINCPTDCVMSSWNPWTKCDATCGGGHSKRFRVPETTESHGGKACGAIEQIKFCNHEPCPVDCVLTGYSAWSVCTKSCGGGFTKRARGVAVAAAFGGVACEALTDSKECMKMPCCRGEHCNGDCVSEVMDWTACDRTCGQGYRTRYLSIEQTTGYGGKNCPAVRHTEPCNDQPCPIDCVLETWNSWSDCDRSCGGGTQKRMRTTSQHNAFGGRPCDHVHEYRLCQAHACPHDCETSAWSSYSPCSITCGGQGSRVRSRAVKREATYGGQACSMMTEGHVCNEGPCPKFCETTNFTSWSDCTAECGGGTQSRLRTIASAGANHVCPALSEDQACNTHHCPLDCEVGTWGAWEACTVTCGTGEHTARREETKKASHGGAACPSLTKTMECNLPNCPIDCELSEWRVWDDCTNSCGGGEQWHVRSVVKSPAFGGRECPAVACELNSDFCPPYNRARKQKLVCTDAKCSVMQEKRKCNENPCPVDCQFGNWSDYGDCLSECGGGVQYRTRNIVVQAEYGGVACPAVQEPRSCHTQPCPVDCLHSAWSAFSPCSKTCGEGWQSRFRAVAREREGDGKDCGALNETRTCTVQECPVDCVVGPWQPFSECDKSCGKGGRQVRIRHVVHINNAEGKECPATSETRECEGANSPCPVYCHTSKWSKWTTCSKTCGGGVRTRTREILDHPHKHYVCPNTNHTETCNTQDCPVPKDCEMKQWSAWSVCKAGDDIVTCGGGVMTRKRDVRRSAQFGGAACGHQWQMKICKSNPCPINCVMHSWDSWNECTAPCGFGHKNRTRSVDVQPKYGGASCPISVQTSNCNRRPCPVDCQTSNWVEEGCTVSCGGGLNTKRRKITIAMRHGGKKCPALTSSAHCNTEACPVDCTVQEWTDWSVCTASCGNGLQYREAKAVKHAQFGGKTCVVEQKRTCSPWPCPIDCELGEFEDWSECSATCGSGTRTRYRQQITKAAYGGNDHYGGKACSHLSETEDCSSGLGPCPVDCEVTKFGRWLECTVTCGHTGYRFRYRSIVQLPRNGGKHCDALTESEKCNLGFCPNDCEVSSWGEWSKCTKICGTGTQKRYRKITRKALHGGRCPVTNELADCNQEACPVDCVMSRWSDYTQCTSTCGTGSHHRTRYVVVPPMHGGKRCGIHTETHRCNTHDCPIDCLMKEYESWSTCTKSCEKGRQMRLRTIWRNAAYGGVACPGLAEERACNDFRCPINCYQASIRGGLSYDWSDWSECSRECGIGTRMKTRDVISVPRFGGTLCGTSSQSELCNLNPCKIDCEVSTWNGWESCTHSCGHEGSRTRWRNIKTAPAFGGKRCPVLSQQQSCQHILKPCPVHCEVAQYGAFSECTATCGWHGTKTRTRSVSMEAAFGGTPCPALSETVPCQRGKCGSNCDTGAWSAFSKCTKSCGSGTRRRTRSIKSHMGAAGKSNCPPTVDEEPCNETPCAQDCVLSEFSKNWTTCSATCGNGFQRKTRTILTAPRNGGKACIHLTWDRACNTKPCPVDCALSKWKPADGCSTTCGKGQRQWYRHTVRDKEFGGKNCGSVMETRTCNDFACPVDCELSDFSDWSECDKTCGDYAVRKRVRSITRQSQAGGLACVSAERLTQHKNCERTACPIDCEQEAWHPWTECTRSCGIGHRRRSRLVIQHARNGGKPCGVAQEVELCNTMQCPTDCEMTEFGFYAKCSKSCGEGSRTRSRNIKKHPTFGGARCPPLYEASYCYMKPCGTDCVVSSWSKWGPCSQACGHGYRIATRTVQVQAAEGGRACPVLEQYDVCMDKLWCPHDCQWKWTPWTTCSRSCGTGIRERKLAVTKGPTVGGKACPDALTEVCNTHECPTAAPTNFYSLAPTPVPAPPPAVTSRPVLDLLGSQIMYIDASTKSWAEIEPGATCTDTKYGDISEVVQVSGSVDTYRTGHSELRYSCCNKDNHCAPVQVRIIIVKDHTCPTCIFREGERILTEASFPFTDPGLVCNDNSMSVAQLAANTEYSCSAANGLSCSGIGGTEPNVEEAGEYYLTYRVKDANGHWNDDPRCRHPRPLVRTVVVTDTLKPVIALQYHGATDKKGRPNKWGKSARPGYFGNPTAGETSKITGKVNVAHQHYPAAEIANADLMEELGSPNGTWFLAAAASAVAAVALLGFAAMRSSGASLATIV